MSVSNLVAGLKNEIERAHKRFNEAEVHLAKAKSHLDGLIVLLAELPDREVRQNIASDLYWSLPAISSHQLAQAVTGRPGKKSLHEFLCLVPPLATEIECSSCGAILIARSRDERNRLLTSFPNLTGRATRCDACPPRKSTFYVEDPVAQAERERARRKRIEQAIEADRALIVSVHWIWGGKDVAMSPALLRTYLADEHGAAAEALGVNKDDYLAWLHSGGLLSCTARTKKGSQCKNVATGPELELDAWLRERTLPAYCHQHQ